jgi:hypothetical protein
MKTTTGDLYYTLLEYLILELGMGTNLTKIDYDKFDILATACLIKSKWKFMYQHDISISHDIIVPTNTTMDCTIMTEFTKFNPEKS